VVSWVDEQLACYLLPGHRDCADWLQISAGVAEITYDLFGDLGDSPGKPVSLHYTTDGSTL